MANLYPRPEGRGFTFVKDNIRPKNFTTSKTKKTNLFSSDKDFINVMAKTVLSDDEKSKEAKKYNGDWLLLFENSYFSNYALKFQ